MEIFRVLLSGSNLWMEVDGNRGRYGFKVARFVEAESAADAAARALDLV